MVSAHAAGSRRSSEQGKHIALLHLIQARGSGVPWASLHARNLLEPAWSLGRGMCVTQLPVRLNSRPAGLDADTASAHQLLGCQGSDRNSELSGCWTIVVFRVWGPAAGGGGARAGAQEPGGDQGAAGGALHRLGARLHPGTASLHQITHHDLPAPHRCCASMWTRPNCTHQVLATHLRSCWLSVRDAIADSKPLGP